LKARLLADADLRFPIVSGLRRREPTLDFQRAQGFIRESLDDPEVLALAADLGRVLVSHDRRTMAGHFYRFLQTRESPGLILVSQVAPIGMVIDELHMVWSCSEEANSETVSFMYVPL